MVPLLPLRDGVRALPISFFRQSMPSFYMNAPDCICSPGRLPLGAFCAGRDDLEREALHDDRISIRAPRAGCDDDLMAHAPVADVSIHAPRAGRDVFFGWRAKFRHAFQSTRPVWGATWMRASVLMIGSFQSTHPVRGATTSWAGTSRSDIISIHAPRAGCDGRSRRARA